ncbi:cyclin-like protein [Rhexocercosporidium sp. MPI-PUGE-AT-0058]|nr:cyclin-like protein [Rhexocercosporidium sp. MPI-PUGE-AT-0058]
MSHLTNPLTTALQLSSNPSSHLPQELQDSIRFYTARLTQAAGILLRLPQDITAQANVLLFRYWVVDGMMEWEFSDISAATLYLTAKISSSPRSLRSITNVYAFLASPTGSAYLSSSQRTDRPAPDPSTYYLSESTYISHRNHILHLEGQILNALSFNTHVALPHPLAITYLQTLDVFSPSHTNTTSKTNSKKPIGTRIAHLTIAHLTTALLSPQLLYLTHQPASLATAAIYLACRQEGLALPEVAWWEVFDCEREELGFLVVAMGSLEGVVRREIERWGAEVGMICRGDVERVVGIGGKNGEGREEDEESEMARLLDEKVGVVGA